MKPNRVLYITGSSGFGGVETFVLTTAKNHNKEKIEAYYYFLNDGPVLTSLRQAGASVFLSKANFRLRRIASYWRTILEIRKLILEKNIDIVHSSMAYSALLGSLASLITSRSHVWFQHGPVGGWMDWAAGNLFSHSILFNSNFTKSAQLSLHHMRKAAIEKKSKVLLLGTEIQKEAPLNLLHAELRIVLLARAQAWKGIDVLIQAAKIAMSKRAKVRLDLYLAGERDAYFISLEKSCAESSDYIKIHKPKIQVGEIFREADCLVNASRTPEPFGLTIIEAMAHWLVPIAPNKGGPLEIIEDNKTGLFFSSSDETDLAEKIIFLFENPSSLKKMKIAAHDSAREKFSNERMISDLEKHYFDMVSNKR